MAAGASRLSRRVCSRSWSGWLTPCCGGVLWRVSVIVFVTTAISSIVFQSTTFALPKIFAERLQDVGASLESGLGALGLPRRVDLATVIGSLAFIVFAV